MDVFDGTRCPWELYVVLLVNDELKVDLKLWNTLSLLLPLFDLLNQLLDRSIEDPFNMINHILHYFVVHLREHDYFKKWLQGS